MKKQDYSNHRKYYIPHHFIFLPLLLTLASVGTWKFFYDASNKLVWGLFTILCLCILYLAVMLRQHYALGNQNRIIRLEFRLRFFEIYKETSHEVESRLSFAQIAALRFAPDSEFKTLLERSLKENLGADQIKRTISNWRADHMRL